MRYVQYVDETETKIMREFGGPQDVELWPNQGEVEDADQRYLDFLNPPENILALQSSKLQVLTQLATAQKVALVNRISTLNDAVDLEIATAEEESELPVRTTQLKEWKTYAVLLGRVTAQQGWPSEVSWPVQPAEGMDLMVSATSQESV